MQITQRSVFTNSLAAERKCSAGAPMQLTSRERNTLTFTHSIVWYVLYWRKPW